MARQGTRRQKRRRHRQRGTGTATALSILLLAVGAAAGWLALAPQFLTAESVAFDAPLTDDVRVVEAEVAPLLQGMRITTTGQISQPRDPFRPLVSEDSQVIGGPGGGERQGLEVALVSVTEVGGSVEAIVRVNGVEYSGLTEGEVFAGSFQVIALFPCPADDSECTPSGVFLFGDNSFEIDAGQTILK